MYLVIFIYNNRYYYWKRDIVNYKKPAAKAAGFIKQGNEF
ncbi:hypothetical protein PPBDW_I21158 [Photobacterium kishitanii]|nr:hypothetical protein PPBDW_I21158 [Photobacterium kishitanii]